MRVRSGTVVATIAFQRIDPDFERAELRFDGLKPPAESFSVRAFVDEPRANGRTPTAHNPRYLGEQYFYGLGAGGDASQTARTQIRLNVTAPVRAYLAHAVAHSAPLSLVAVDRDGDEIAQPDLDVEGITLVTTR